MDYSRGLEGVIAGETAISNVEGDIGRLSYRGYAIEELVELDYVAVMWLVLFGELPDPRQTEQLAHYLARHGRLEAADKALLGSLPGDLHPMRMLQSLIPVVSTTPDDFNDLGDEASRGLQIIARLPALVAGHYRPGLSNEMPEFDLEKEHLANFLTMFTGRSAPETHVDLLKVVQVLQMEHSFNASTFVGRCVASTLAPIESVLSAATGSLAGILHGGADEAALNDAKRAGSPQGAPAFVDELLGRKGKLMGMGHREYRVVDPRSVILKPMARQLCEGTEFENTFNTLQALESAFSERMREKGKDLEANLEFYKGAVLEAIGIPSRYFTAVFVMSRAVGWLSHFVESRQDNRIVRPKAAYVGPAPRRVRD